MITMITMIMMIMMITMITMIMPKKKRITMTMARPIKMMSMTIMRKVTASLTAMMIIVNPKATL